MRGGQFLREARKRARMTQAQVAAAAGTTQSAVARVEAEAQAPTLEQLTKLVRACGYDLSIRLVKADPELSLHVRDALTRSPERRLREVLSGASLLARPA